MSIDILQARLVAIMKALESTIAPHHEITQFESIGSNC